MVEYFYRMSSTYGNSHKCIARRAPPGANADRVVSDLVWKEVRARRPGSCGNDVDKAQPLGRGVRQHTLEGIRMAHVQHSPARGVRPRIEELPNFATRKYTHFSTLIHISL